MDLRWLSAPDHEVAAAMATVHRESRPSWVPTKRQLLVHINHCLILWYLCIAFMTIGVRVDTTQLGQMTPADTGAIAVTVVVLAAWLFGTFWLYRWAARPPSSRSSIREWRQTLTGLANGFEYDPSPVATFRALITRESRRVHEYPRFEAPGVEFGNLVRRSTGVGEWHYLVAALPAPLPHLILDSTANDRRGSDLPAGPGDGQRLSLEGDFDRWFRVYSPTGYGADALYVLTPDIMATLVDDASAFNVEIIDDRVVFFSSPSADFGDAATWESLDIVLGRVVPRLAAKARQYLDDRVPGQEVPRLALALAAQRDAPSVPWLPPTPRIAQNGRRLRMRNRQTGFWGVVRATAWFSLLAFLYAVPGIFAFSGFMSAIDGW